MSVNTLHPSPTATGDADVTVKLRIFSEPTTDGAQWTVDGVDTEGNYSERVWSFDTFSEAVAALGLIAIELGMVSA